MPKQRRDVSQKSSGESGPKPRLPARIIPSFRLVIDTHEYSGTSFLGKTAREALVRAQVHVRERGGGEIELEDPSLADAVTWETPVFDSARIPKEGCPCEHHLKRRLD